MDTLIPNPRAVIGGNSPPEPTPFESAAKAVNDIYDEAKLWIDGAVVDSQDLADGITNLKNTILKAKQLAEASKGVEKRPHLDANIEIEARYKPLIAKADLAIDACKKANAPWLIKVDQENKRIALEAAQKAEAERKAAEEAMRASSGTNFTERAEAEELAKRAKEAEAEAARAARAKPLSGGVVGRRDGLVTVYTATMTERRDALKHFAATRPIELTEWLQSMADAHVRTGAHTADELPGFKISSEQKVR